MRGRNLLIPVAGDIGPKYGFYASRVVEAEDETGAGQAAIALLRSEPWYSRIVRNANDDPPKIGVCQAFEANPELIGKIHQGLVWHLENPGQGLPRAEKFDEILLLDLQGLKVNKGNLQRIALGAPVKRIGDADAREIGGLWAVMPPIPPEEEGRCHMPPFALDFRRDGTSLLLASVCWECGNIYAHSDGLELHYRFNARCDAAQQLLAILEKVAGHPACE